ncbi:MAG TPA: glycoside hydrolase family 3 C-terminal domain-containing protein [Dehalococcoidia bacterium]|nr:glycoside hydrolase family 3 C-terminal domain-containing protein [Dehalococcoidia bacterium]
MTTDDTAPIASFDDARARVRAGEDPDDVARRFVAALTLDEKLWCLDGDEEFWPGMLRMAGGASARVAGGGYARDPWIGARLRDRAYPGIAFSDGPRGVAVGTNTCFPVSMARGATWDPDLEERIGEAVGRELRARGANLFGGVNVNLLRHPAWGRAQETYGEDPHHVGEMGAALARGVQRHAMACVKHYAMNSIENARFQVDVRADDRALHEVYLPHFKRVVDEGVACVMSAYNSVNGDWCGQNHALLTDILRDEWGFRGYVISDWIFGLRDAPKSVLAGLDIEMPFRQQRMQHLPAALAEGAIREADVDPLVAHVAATLLRFDDVLSRPAPPESVCASEEHRALAYEAAAKSIVLLKNEGEAGPLLPLDAKQLKRVAVLGRLAAVPNLGDRGSSNVTPPSVVTPLDGLRAALPGVEITHAAGADLDEAARVARDADAVIVVVGCTYEDEGEYISAQPELFMATAPPRPPRPERPEPERRPRPEPAPSERTERDQGFALGGDRASLDLSPADEALVHIAATANARTAVALMGGSAIMVERWHDEPAAILMLWYPGMEGGRALADVLLGRVNPTGRLPFAVPTDAAHLPFFDRAAHEITYDLFHGQWLLDRDAHAARYPFGFGLSYTPHAAITEATVSSADLPDRTDRMPAADAERSAQSSNDTATEVRHPSVNRARTSVSANDTPAGTAQPGVVISAQITNDSDRAATEVVQVYYAVPQSHFARPQRRLAAFARVDVPPRSSLRVELPVPFDRVAVRDNGGWLVEAGTYEFTVARHAHDPGAITASIDLPERRARSR